MGFLSDIGNLFSSKPGIQGANQAYQGVTGGIKKAAPLYQTGYDTSTGQIDTSTGQQIGALGTAGTQGQGYLGQGLEALQGAKPEALGYLDTGTGQQVNTLSGALQPFEDIYGTQSGGQQAYLNALGLNGPEGSAAARGMFQESPGYQYQLGQGLEGVLRKQAAAGGLNSGATSMDLNDYAQNTANQGWNTWLNRLQQFDPMEAAKARAGVLGQIGDVYGQSGAAKAGVTTGLARNQADIFGSQAELARQLGGAEADVYGGAGRTKAGLTTGLYDTLANLQLQKGQAKSQQAQDIYGAKMVPGQNFLSLAQTLINAGAKVAGGMGGGAA